MPAAMKLVTNPTSGEVHITFVQADVPGFASYEICNLDAVEERRLEDWDDGDLSLEQWRTRVEQKGLSCCEHCWPAGAAP